MDLECEVCGKENVVAVVQIEGAKLNTCPECARMGKVLYKLDDSVEGKQVIRNVYSPPMEKEEIIDEYASVIRKKRETFGLSLKDLGHK
ncbi:hypothetical protein HYT84_01810, partial [Candidatus Micrarchaeota archaeon]|nr:hypothetical protein [Candidatus Micrarchaeota archaeon]